MKLISSKNFGKTLENENDSEYRRKRDLYDSFIEQPLKLEMFVPCDDEGNVLDESIWQQEYNKIKVSNPSLIQKSKEYEKAKEKVLFKSLSEEDGKCYIEEYGNIENFCNNWNIELTENATKQFL